MKFMCTRENLANALTFAGAVASKVANLPVLNNVLIQADETKVEILSTNLEQAVAATVRAKVEGKGGFTVPAKTLGDYVRFLTEEQVEVERQENELKITCGSSSTKIKGAPADEFPVLPEVEEKRSYALLLEPFRDALAKTVIAAAKNEIRPELSGVFFRFFSDRHTGLVLAATDSYRLAEKKTSVVHGEEPGDYIVPARAIQEMIRLLSLDGEEADGSLAHLAFSDTQILLRHNGFEFSSRLVDGKYPDYAQIIPNSFKTTAVFPAEVMVNKIKAAGLFTTAGVNAVSFDFNVSGHTLGVSSTSTQKGEYSSEIDAEVAGEENSILLNHHYLLDGLQHTGGDVEFKMNTADSPCLLKQKGKDDYLYIVMPIRQ